MLSRKWTLVCFLEAWDGGKQMGFKWIIFPAKSVDYPCELQHPALCYKPHVNCNGQDMVISAKAKDRLVNQLHLRRNDAMMASMNGKGKGCASYYRSQHCECNGCKEQYMMDLCAYANQKLRSGCSDENGHWITTDSECTCLLVPPPSLSMLKFGRTITQQSLLINFSWKTIAHDLSLVLSSRKLVKLWAFLKYGIVPGWQIMI